MSSTPLPLAELVPEHGFLADYVAYARKRVMAPVEFHLACGLGALSAVCGSALRVMLGDWYWYSTLWIVLIGPSGRARKSSSIRLGLKLAGEVLEGLALPYDFSREALLQTLVERPTGYLDVGEFGGFLARAGREYMGGVKQDLSEMWDSREEVERRTTTKTYTVKLPRLTIMGGCPPEDFLAFTRAGDLKQGFTSRFLLIPMDVEADVPYVGMVRRDHEARQHLVEQLRGFAQLRRDVRDLEVSDAAQAQWEGYDQLAAADAAGSDPELSGWETRRGIWTLKLAALLSVSATGQPVLDRQELARAWEIVNSITVAIRGLAQEATPAATPMDRVRHMRDRAIALSRQGDGGVINRRALFNDLKYLGLSRPRELDDALAVWIEAGEFERGTLKTPGAGRPSPGYRYMNGKPAPEHWIPDGAE